MDVTLLVHSLGVAKAGFDLVWSSQPCRTAMTELGEAFTVSDEL